jgi:acyl-CoA-binding protein
MEEIMYIKIEKERPGLYFLLTSHNKSQWSSIKFKSKEEAEQIVIVLNDFIKDKHYDISS